MTEREIKLLSAAADTPGDVSLEAFAQALLPDCPGPRTARRYAEETAWRLLQAKLLQATDTKRRGRCYSITRLGRRYLAQAHFSLSTETTR